jgi:hypothetical protein
MLLRSLFLFSFIHCPNNHYCTIHSSHCSLQTLFSMPPWSRRFLYYMQGKWWYLAWYSWFQNIDILVGTIGTEIQTRIIVHVVDSKIQTQIFVGTAGTEVYTQTFVHIGGARIQNQILLAALSANIQTPRRCRRGKFLISQLQLLTLCSWNHKDRLDSV